MDISLILIIRYIQNKLQIAVMIEDARTDHQTQLVVKSKNFQKIILEWECLLYIVTHPR